ncbi:hypothetical protein AMECASPLE_006703 [Ameca splendens]|uniref:CD3 gamma/delta subunit Ig-like domain-containing protein n=1 Tax=Ameca splendens TaxID=208324 RepID=A0ABV0YAH8_9TELE
MGVQAVWLVLLLFVVRVETQKGGVTFWGGTVTLTCPENGTWTGLPKPEPSTSKTHEFQYKGQAQYVCAYQANTEGEEQKYLFYVKGKACENCFEVDGFLFMLVILIDVIVTAIVMRIIYVCTKKKSPDPPPQPQRARGSRPGPDQSSAYESLNPNTQSTLTYSTVVHRTG